MNGPGGTYICTGTSDISMQHLRRFTKRDSQELEAELKPLSIFLRVVL